MHMDFALILTLLTLVTFVFWLIERLVFRKRGPEQGGGVRKTTETLGSLFPVLLLVLVFRSFLFEPFKIPSGSMIPTLWIGDFIVVNKYAYGLRLPVLNSKVIPIDDPERGDIIVFRFPEDERVNYIKRVVGLPGDTISYRDKQLFVNGEKVEQEVVGSWVGKGLNRNVPGRNPVELLEYFDDESHRIVVYPERPNGRVESVTVPEGQYFVMGDNRDQSLDSRAWGFVPEENLVGKAVRIWMHWDCSRGCVDFSRIGDKIQ
ncbi:signal peptidase I [Wenzhouxiangella sp. XN201]|uniref:signal peptidase I n=1 Tax=Wenzhouxiangella sp. XN201 TaxID=2710755 RepID=UPI0013C6C0CF|nr:signal peptidase I [Wenzhouxiangella sp. XN201]NEZ05124.1 signal peptidase I [Wenzhouxiangella sp. XN201]